MAKRYMMYILKLSQKSSADDLVKYLEEEEEAFDRVRIMLTNLIDQAQTAVVEEAPLPNIPPPKHNNSKITNI